MPSLELNGRRVGDGQRVFVIAEAGDNHLGDVERAKEMARLARIAGADAVKFQHHLPDEEMLPDVPMSDNFDEPLYEFLRKHALRIDEHAELMAYCRELGIAYMCTPFSYAAAVQLAELGIESFKIGSGELTDIPSLLRIAELGRPMMLSTGMATLEEIDATVDAMRGTGAAFALMNCVSEYPAAYEDVNLGVIAVLRDRYPDLVVGHSDHTPDLVTSFAAIALGARVLEKHLILDRQQRCPDRAVSIEPDELAELVDGVRKLEAALGSEKRVHEGERAVRAWAHRSVVTLRPLAAGTVIEEGDVWTKRPGTGIPSRDLPLVLGRRLARDVGGDVILAWEDLE
jgi:N,N'-diacetyllegionaminate synthase